MKDREPTRTLEMQLFERAFPLERIVQPEMKVVFKHFLANRVANYQDYAAIPDVDFSKPMTTEILTDSPRKELIHQIRNTIMRANVIQGCNPFDFSGYEKVADLEGALYGEITKQDLLSLYLSSTGELYDLFTYKTDVVKEQGDHALFLREKQVYPVDMLKEIDGFGGEKMTVFELMLIAYGDEARHSGINIRDLAPRGIHRPSQDKKNWG